MMQEVRVEAPETEVGTHEQRVQVVTRFLRWWLGSVLALVFVALLTNIEWARPHIEKSLEDSFHRDARLGRLSWHLGMNGLFIETNHFVLEARDGAPFIQAGRSQMGVAFLPLFQNRVVIKHVIFGTPEVWAVKETPDRWNFSDLITAGPEIHQVQVEDGTLHLVNRVSGAKWKQYELNNIDLKFGFPRKQNESWPLYFDCRIPVRHGVSKVKLSATGTGPFEAWKKRPSQFNLELNNFNPEDFRSLVTDLPDINGVFDFKLKGAGIYERGAHATVSGGVKNLVVPSSGGKNDKAENAKLASVNLNSDLVISDEAVSWNNADVRLDSWKIKSTGELRSSKKDKLRYQASVDGELGDLQGLYTRVLSQFFSVPAADLQRFSKPSTIGKGSAAVSLQLSGTPLEHELAATVKATGIPLQDLLDLGVKEYSAYLPELKPDAPVSGLIQVALGHVRANVPASMPAPATAKRGPQKGGEENPKSKSPLPVVSLRNAGNTKLHPAQLSPCTKNAATGQPPLAKMQFLNEPLTVVVKDFQVPFEGSVLRLNGSMNGCKNESGVEFSLNDFEASNLTKLPRQILDEQTMKSLLARKLTGKMDLSGKVEQVGSQRTINIKSILNGVSVCTESGSTLAQSIKGQLTFDGERIDVSDLSGMLPCSSIPYCQFSVAGHIMASGSASLDIAAKQVDLCKLRQLAKEAGVVTKFTAAGIAFDRITGRLQDLKLQVNGAAPNPKIAFTVTNPDVKIERDDSHGKKFFRVYSGKIDHFSNQTEIKDVVVAAPGSGGKLTVSANLQGSLDKPGLKFASLVSDGVELAEWRPLMGPSLLPESLLESLPVAFRPIKNAPAQGRLYGDIKVTEVSDGFEADGVFGFHNAGTRVGPRSVSLDKLTGVIVFSSKEVILQDLTGTYGRSNFLLDGLISDYRQKFNWTGQLKGKFYPEELASITRATGTGLDLESAEREPVALRLAGAGTAEDYKLFFNGHSEAGDGLRLSVGSVDVHQPAELPITFDGGVRVKTSTPSIIEMDKCVVLAGDHTLKLQGSLKDSGKGAVADMKLTTPDGMPLALVLQMLYPSKSFDALGRTDLALSFSGPADALHLNGQMKLSNVAMPSMSIANLNAKLELPDLALNPKKETAGELSKLTVSNARIGGFEIHDGEAELATDGGKNLRLSLYHGSAKIAGGRVKMSGFFEPDQSKYHAELSLSKLAVREFVDDLIKGDGKVSGQADVNFVVDGETGSNWLESLNGKGKFSVYEGTIQTVGKLQGKLHGANLLQQGLFGFNINNFVQAVHPSKTGAFKEIDGQVSIQSGVIALKQIRYDGNDLRMRAAGVVNLPAGTVDIDVAGDIPRVAASMIPGAVGEMSREVTLQKLLGIVTFKQLEDLPSLPLLGDIASDHPRVFSFVVNAPLAKPELISKSVEKSFKWIPAKPYASAHPVPGL